MAKSAEDPSLLRLLPIGQYEYVDAEFVAADTDTVIPYSILRPEDVNEIRWINVTQGAGLVYRAADPNRVTWGDGYVILRNTQIESVRLLLFLERS